MSREQYMKQLFEAYNEGRISTEAYDLGVMNVELFCDDDDDEE